MASVYETIPSYTLIHVSSGPAVPLSAQQVGFLITNPQMKYIAF